MIVEALFHIIKKKNILNSSIAVLNLYSSKIEKIASFGDLIKHVSKTKADAVYSMQLTESAPQKIPEKGRKTMK